MISQEKLKNDVQKIQHAFIMTMVLMIDSKDKGVYKHAKRTSKYAELLCRELVKMGYYLDRIDEQFITKLIYTAPLHDIGKLYTPDEILNKPGKLTNEEFEIMKLHTVEGANIVEGIIKRFPNNTNYTDLLTLAKEISLYHHEKWDGTGYPERLSESDIPLSARIIAVADVFDALTSKRVYRDAMSYEEALNIIKDGSKTHFDPKIVLAFMHAFESICQASCESNTKVM